MTCVDFLSNHTYPLHQLGLRVYGPGMRWIGGKVIMEKGCEVNLSMHITFFLLQAPAYLLSFPALSWLDQATISVPFSLSLSRALPMPTLLSLYFSISLPYFLTSVYQSSSIPIINLNPCPLLLLHLLWLYVCAPTGNFTYFLSGPLHSVTYPTAKDQGTKINFKYRLYVPDRLLSISIETQSQGHDYEAMLFIISM